MRRALAVVTGAAVLAGFTVPGPAGRDVPIHLDQGWSAAERQAFYTTDQGSRMMPLSWLLALDRPASREPFLAGGLARHGFLPADPSGRDAAERLPVGFAVDGERPGRWVGLTCAACHTGQLRFRGRSIRIDGGPADADMYGMFVELRDALAATVADREGERFARFAGTVLRRPVPARTDALHAEVSAFLADWRRFLEGSATEVPWGPGRLDGFGMTFNRLAAIGLGIPDNNAPPDGAVSYPFLWGSPWHDRTQWTGVVEHDDDLGRLARNVGEVLGVFAHARLRRPMDGRRYYRTSADRTNLLALEDRVKRLRAPAWPEELLGPIDPDRAAAGAELYRVHCASCHPIVAPGTPVTVRMTPVAEVGTDPIAARNNCTRTVRTGRLEGAFLNPLLGAPLPPVVGALEFLDHVVAGAILAPASGESLSPGAARGVLVTPGAQRDCGPGDPLMRYKARPLEGVWATAPFLHNGSVPTLHDLLLPPERRPRRFPVGGRELDPARVGLSRRGDGRGVMFDTRRPGNSAAGHDYATGELSESERRELVEYLKTL